MAIRSWTQLLNDEGALGTTARASLQLAAAKFRHCPLEMAFPSRQGRFPLCPSVVARNMATLLMANHNPIGGPEILSGNQMSTSISSRILISLDEDGCPMESQPLPQATLLLRRLVPLWEHGIHNWAQILCRGPDGRPYFLKERELKWANPSLCFPLLDALIYAIKYFRALLSFTDSSHWLSPCQKIILGPITRSPPAGGPC